MGASLSKASRGGAKAAFFTLGCRVNQYETRAMEEQFLELGFEIVPFSEDITQNCADVFVINTCTVTAESDRKCRNMIRRACEKAKQSGAIVIVCGCYSQHSAQSIAQIEGVSLIIGNQGKSRVAARALELLKKDSRFGCEIDVTDISAQKNCEKMSISASDRTRAFIKIVDGCDNKCAYCIIPSVRGHVRSRAQEEIIAEAEVLASAGYKEIVLTGIETAAYGTDFEEKRGDALLSLVKKASELEGICRIRFGSLEPTLFLGDFAAKLAEFPKVMPHFHLSLQSGSSKVLALMKRKYNAEMFAKCVENIRKSFSDVTITTDIIVGFPGERIEDFNESAKMIADCSFAYAHIFPFSTREGTVAASLPDQLTGSEKKQRASSLNAVMIDTRRKVLGGFIGKKAQILIETTDGKNAVGHSENFVEYTLPYISGITEENSIVEVEAFGISEDGMRMLGRI